MTILSNNITYSYEGILGTGQELILNNKRSILHGAHVIVYTKPSNLCNAVITNVHKDIENPNNNDVVSVTANNGIYSVPDNPELKQQDCNIGLMEYNGKLYIVNYEKVENVILCYIGQKIVIYWEENNDII